VARSAVVIVAAAGDRPVITPLNILTQKIEKEGEYSLEYTTWTLLGDE
jgi:hypothetical protein